jgi:hypothetical protein
MVLKDSKNQYRHKSPQFQCCRHAQRRVPLTRSNQYRHKSPQLQCCRHAQRRVPLTRSNQYRLHLFMNTYTYSLLSELFTYICVHHLFKNTYTNVFFLKCSRTHMHASELSCHAGILPKSKHSTGVFKIYEGLETAFNAF